MPEIEIRPAIASDIEVLIGLDHHYLTDHVWQMETGQDREIDQVTVSFRKMRLPRSVRVEYPRSPLDLSTEWARLSGLLTATLGGHPVGYAGLALGRLSGAVWVTDLVVDRDLRRKGIGTGLVLAAIEWAAAMDCFGVVLEMQPKNHPAIRLANKLGFEFCGYNDIYYANHEIGIFFHKSI